jgi:hypothetical protein
MGGLMVIIDVGFLSISVEQSELEIERNIAKKQLQLLHIFFKKNNVFIYKAPTY